MESTKLTRQPTLNQCCRHNGCRPSTSDNFSRRPAPCRRHIARRSPEPFQSDQRNTTSSPRISLSVKPNETTRKRVISIPLTAKTTRSTNVLALQDSTRPQKRPTTFGSTMEMSVANNSYEPSHCSVPSRQKETPPASNESRRHLSIGIPSTR